MTSLGIAPLIQNQLQFNLAVPPAVGNYTSQQRRPGPIVIEKLGVPSASPKPAQNPLRFSNISEEEMDVAVRLARRDLKKKKMEVEMEQYMQKMAARASPKIDKKEDDRRKARERLGIGSGSTPRRARQTQTTANTKGNKVMRPRPKPRPDSPPTRDTDSYPPKLTPDERTALEIRRLRKDLKTYIDEINRIDTVLNRPEPTNLVQDITDEEYYQKRKARVLGRATRSSRMVYDLKQQVKTIYDEIRYMKPDVEPRKKSDVIKRLASVHRATVRSLQDLIHQLPEAGHDDVGKLSRELATLIEQLTECCQQMEIGEIKEKESVAKFVDKNPVAASVWKEVVDGPIEFTNIQHRPYHPKEVVKEVRIEENEGGNESDDRARALRVGLENLLRARSPQKEAEKSQPSVRIEQPKMVREEAKPASKGVLINRPAKKKAPKRPTLKPSVVIERSERPHYTEATIAHRRKVRDPVERQPARSRSRSPRAPSPRIVSTDRIEKLNLGIPNEWVEQAETAIKQRLQPLLTQAKRLNKAQQSPNSMRQLLSVKALDRIECNASLLVDLILEDLLKDTACEMVALETAEKIENDAMMLMQGSEVHTMMDRLELMDREQMEIRERWNSVRYNDTVEVPPIVFSETPRTPQPTLLDSETAPPPLEPAHPPRPKLEKSPIVFTNEPMHSRLRSEKLQMLRTETVKREMGLHEVPQPAPVITEDEVENIHEYRNLKMITKEKRKKSVKAMETLADEVMDQIIQEIGQEMIHITSEIDEQICMQELALGRNIHFSTDTDNQPDEMATDDERFPVAFRDDDSCMDLHDMIHDDHEYSHVTPQRSFHDNEEQATRLERIAADAAEQRRQLFHSKHIEPVVEENEERSHHDNNAEENELSYHDDRRQAEEIRNELDQFEVGHLETVARESLEPEESEDEETDEEESNRNRAALMSQDVNDLEPIRGSQDTEEIATEEAGDVEYSSEFVTTTAEDSTGHDSGR